MSIGIYAFLRIYFFWFWAVRFCTVSDTLRKQSSVWASVCPSTCPLCFLAWSALLPVVCRRSGCAGGWGLHLWGIWVEPGVGWSTPRVEKIQKRRFPFLPPPLFCTNHPTPYCQSQKFRRKNKKTPTKGLRSVLYLPYKP